MANRCVRQEDCGIHEYGTRSTPDPSLSKVRRARRLHDQLYLSGRLLLCYCVFHFLTSSVAITNVSNCLIRE